MHPAVVYPRVKGAPCCMYGGRRGAPCCMYVGGEVHPVVHPGYGAPCGTSRVWCTLWYTVGGRRVPWCIPWVGGGYPGVYLPVCPVGVPPCIYALPVCPVGVPPCVPGCIPSCVHTATWLCYTGDDRYSLVVRGERSPEAQRGPSSP